jgi:hypothetical protein
MTQKREDFKSPLEYNTWRWLQEKRKGKKFKVEYETEKLNYILTKYYLPDFILHFEDGRKIYIETKGYLRGEDRTKLLAVRDNNPDIDLRLVFSKDNRLNRKARSRYSCWAKRHGFTYSVGSIPMEWLDDSI